MIATAPVRFIPVNFGMPGRIERTVEFRRRTLTPRLR